MRRTLAVGIVCGGLAACSVPSPWTIPQFPDWPVSLAADRKACDQKYPAQTGNYLPHAQCVNAAVERDAIPFSRHPDIVRLQEQLRIRYSTLIDRGAMSPAEGQRRMREADQIVDAAIRDRDRGQVAAASHRVDRLQAMLQ